MGSSLYEKFQAEQAKPGSLYAEFQGEQTPQRRAGDKPRGYRTPEQIARLNKNDQAQADDEMANDEATTRGKVLGTLAAPLSEVPGGKAVQSLVGGVGNGGYRKGLENVEGAIESAPAAARIPAKLLGSGISAAILPGSAAMQGARFGVAAGLLQADPDKNLGGRIKDAAIEGTIGLASGKVADLAGKGIQAAGSKRLGANAVDRRAAIQAADEVAYGTAAREGKLIPKNIPMQRALAEPALAPYLKEIDASPTLRGADDATRLREAYKLLSEREGMLSSRLRSADDFKAGSTLEKADIREMKRGLLRASVDASNSPAAMPSFPGAVRQHARLKGEEFAFQQGSDLGRTLLGNGAQAGKRLATKSPDAFLQSIDQMRPEEASAALEGVLGRLKEVPRLSANPLSGFGTLSSAAKMGYGANRLSPVIEALESRAGVNRTAFQKLLQSMASTSAIPTP